jgi:hypothetical protein
VLYSAFGLDMTSISISYFLPSPGIMRLKCFQGFPLGSFIKNLTLNISSHYHKSGNTYNIKRISRLRSELDVKAIGRISVDGNTQNTHAYYPKRDQDKDEIINDKIFQGFRQP